MSALALTNIALNAAVLSTALNAINAEIENWLNGVTASADITLTGVMTAANFTASAGGALRSSTSDTNTLLLQAYDVDGTSYTTFITLTAGNTPTCVISSGVTATTQSASDNSTKLATTQYVDSAILVEDFWTRTSTTITMKNSGDTFKLNDDEKIEFRNSNFFINSSDTSTLQLVASGGIRLENRTALAATISNLEIEHTTSVTPADGIGIGILFVVETASGNNESGMGIEAVTTDVTPTSEDFDFVLKLMAGGATRSEVLRVTSAGNVSFTGSLTDGTAILDGSGAWTGITNLTMSGTLDLGTNTIVDGTMSGNWAFSAGNFTGVGTIGSAAITSTGSIQGSSITDGTGTLSSGALSGITTLVMSGNLTIDTNTLFVDTSGNKVGIGLAASLDAPLHIQKDGSTEYSPSIMDSENVHMLKLQNSNTTATAPFCTIHFRLDDNGTDGFLGFVGGPTGNIGDFVLGHDNTEYFRIDTSGNLGLNTATFGSSASGVLAIANGTQGGALANAIQIISEDLSAGNTILSLRTEGTGIETAGSATINRTIAIKINGTVRYLMASDTVAA